MHTFKAYLKILCNFRLLARLYLDTNPAKSLAYANHASTLGDIPATSVHADILDAGKAPDSAQVTATRLRKISQLLAKLDPIFAFNVGRTERIKKSGFITFITGIEVT